MLDTVRWSWAWCPIVCRTVWTPSRTLGRTRGTGLLQVPSWVLFRSDVWAAVNELSCMWPPPHSVLFKLRTIHVLCTHLRLELRQRQQGELWPHLLLVWRRVQSAGFRQVRTAALWDSHVTSQGIPGSLTVHKWHVLTEVPWTEPHLLVCF